MEQTCNSWIRALPRAGVSSDDAPYARTPEVEPLCAGLKCHFVSRGHGDSCCCETALAAGREEGPAACTCNAHNKHPSLRVQFVELPLACRLTENPAPAAMISKSMQGKGIIQNKQSHIFFARKANR